MPTTNRKVGNTRSVGVRPFHSAWFMKCHEPEPPLLFTMIMKQMVMPRSTSSESRRPLDARACEGLVIGTALSRVRVVAMVNTLRAYSPIRQVICCCFLAPCGSGISEEGNDTAMPRGCGDPNERQPRPKNIVDLTVFR